MRLRTVLGLLLVLGVWTSAGAIGPFGVAGDDNTALKLQLAGQFQTVWESRDGGSGDDRESSLYMQVRRVRPVLVLDLPDYRTSFRLHVNLSPGAAELLDFQFDVVLRRHLQVRVGQYKIPFTRYRIQSFQRLTFVDWSVVTRYFGAERQFGLTVHNDYEKPPRLAYALGVFNGVNSRASHAIGLASVFGERVSNASDLSGGGRRAEFHPELVGHVAYCRGGIEVASDSDLEGGGLRYMLASSVAWDLDPNAYEDLALRFAQEFLVKYRGVSFMGVGYVGLVTVDGSLRTRMAMAGVLGQSAWRVSRRCEVSVRYAVVDIDDAVADAAVSRAQGIIGGTDNEGVMAQYGDAGMVRAVHEGTLGFNVYVEEHGFKIQNDVGFTRQERRDADRVDYVIRSQIQVAF
jgi:hypothetical protein